MLPQNFPTPPANDKPGSSDTSLDDPLVRLYMAGAASTLSKGTSIEALDAALKVIDMLPRQGSSTDTQQS